MQEQLAQTNLFQQLIITDYFFIKTLLFAKNNLNSEEYRLFQRLFNILNTSFPKPELIVFLHRSVDNLLELIKKRGRSYEQDIAPSYLLEIQNTYFEYFRTEQSIPILIIDVEKLNFQNNEKHYKLILDAMQSKYQPGIHHISFVD